MRAANLLRWAGSAVLLPLLFALVGNATAQTIVTDKDDYLPGETTYFAGAGFQPGESIGLTLRVETATDEAIDYAIGGITVVATGDFTAAWLVPQEALNSTITATAVGLSSKRIAETVFTDGGVTLTATSYLLSSPSGNNLSFSVNLSATGGTAMSITSAAMNFSPTLGAPVTLTGPGGNGSGVWTGTAAGACGTTYTIANIQVNVVATGGSPAGSHSHNKPAQPAVSPSASTASCLPCLTNAAPTLACSSKDFGDQVGCLSAGVMSTTVSFSAADFSCVMGDPDGTGDIANSIVTILNSPSPVTFTGPGMHEVEVTLSVTDDPSGRQSTSSCPLVAQTTTTTAKVKVRITYAFDGFLAPLSASGMGLFKKGSTIPMKFRLRDCNGSEVSPSNLASLDIPTNKPSLGAVVVSSLAPAGDGATADSGSSNDNTLLFRYSGLCGVDGNWIYNLSLKEAGWTVGLTYKASVALDDGTTHCRFFTLKK